MNSFYEYFAAWQKLAAYRQAKRMQRGVKLGENQVPWMATKLTTPKLHIGTGDFSVEFYGNSYGSDDFSGFPFIRHLKGSTANKTAFSLLAEKDTNGISFIQFGDTNLPSIGYRNMNDDGLFHAVVTRTGNAAVLYIDGVKFKEFSTIEICDFGNIDLFIANSRNVELFRVWNMCLSADEIASLYNNGDPMGYVVPKAKRSGLLAEYLPQNLMYGRDNKTIAVSWLDSAKQLPLSDEYMEPLFQSIGGYDMIANGAPEILSNE